MRTQRRAGLIRRFVNLIQGLFAVWLTDREGDSPRAVYERAIAERTQQYAGLKRAVAGILYMRNKLEGEIRERRGEIARTQSELYRAVRRADDEVALTLIAYKDSLLEELERADRELGEVSGECETAKENLVKFRSEIQALEREKTRMLATLANAQARRRIHEALQGLSVESDVQALESVREQIAQLKAEGNIEVEMGERGLVSRMREIRLEARREAATRELAELKRRLHPPKLSAPEPSRVASSV